MSNRTSHILKRLLTAAAAICLFMSSACSLLKNGKAPDYSDMDSWAYYAEGENKDADLFLICPTVDMNDEYNMKMSDKDTKAAFLGALNMERGIYEDTARMFAPYYRQVAMKVYSMEADKAEKYFRIAYEDVSNAFKYYLENENSGRPIILAGFSQGADMCYRLLEEYFCDEELMKKLIAVYAMGWPLTDEMTDKYPQMKPALSASDTGVIISFECESPELEETFIVPKGTRMNSINPLNWKTDGTVADKSLNMGACFTNYGGEIKSEVKELCGAYIDEERGTLKVTDIDAADYKPVVPGLPQGSYHIYDYQFFFRNLEKNVSDRVAAYLATSELSGKIAEIKERGVLLVGATGDYKPMSFLDKETGKYWGFDTALAMDLAQALGVKIEFVKTTWPTLMDDTKAGKFDLAITGITVTDARKEEALMSDGYLENGKTVLCRKGDALRFRSLEAINRPDVTVMENPGGLNEKFARENLPKAKLIIHEVNEEIPGLIADGKADVMITEILEAGYYCSLDKRLAAPLIDSPFTNGQLGMLMSKGSEDLLDYVNRFIAIEKETGRIDELYRIYVLGNGIIDIDEAA